MTKVKVLAVCLSAILIVGVLGMDVAAVQENMAAAPNAAQEETAEETASGIAVSTITPEIGTIAITGEYMATVEPYRQIAVYPKAAGEVLSVHFNVGDYVKEGDILFEIDSTALEYTIAQTEAAIEKGKASAQQGLAAARASLSAYDREVQRAAQTAIENAQIGWNNADIGVDVARSRRDQAKINLDSARQQLKDFDNDIMPLALRSPSLPDKPSDILALSEETYYQLRRQLNDAVKQAKETYEQADLGVDSAKETRDAAALGIEKANEAAAELPYGAQRTGLANQIKMAEISTNFEDQEIAIESMYYNLENYKVKAPFSGIIERRAVEPFSMAAPQAPAFFISDMSNVIVSYKVSRESREIMDIGDRVDVEDTSGTYRGIVTEISTGADMSGLFTVKAIIYYAPPNLFAGVTVRVYTVVQETDDALIVPIGALYYERGVPYVYIAKNGAAHKVAVEVGLYDSERAEILSGIEPTDQIISTWSHNLADGAAIVIVS